MKLNYFILLLIFFASIYSCKETPAKESDEAGTSMTDSVPAEEISQSRITLLTPSEFEAAIKSNDAMQILDVRTPEEVAEGTIAGSTNISVTTDGFTEKIQSLDKSKPVYVFCKMGGRSARAAGILKEAGFLEIYDLDGGITAWMESGKAVEKY